MGSSCRTLALSARGYVKNKTTRSWRRSHWLRLYGLRRDQNEKLKMLVVERGAIVGQISRIRHGVKDPGCKI
jgi:hypothetical protein